MSKIVPSPKSLPFFGTLLSLMKEGGGPQLHKYVNKRHKELGSIYKEKIGPVEAYFLNDPVDMRKVFAAEGTYPVHVLPECWTKYNSLYGSNRGLYFMDGQEWMKNRKIMNKYLLKNFNIHMQHDLTRDLFKMFEQHIVSYHDGMSGTEVESYLYQLSINFIIAYMMGTPFIPHYESLTCEVEELSLVVRNIFEYSVALSMLPIDLSVKLKLPAWKNFVQCVDRSLALASAVCDKLEKFNGDGFMSKLKEENVPSDLIRRIVIDFILAAGDTTATSTQWIFYLLGRHPLIQTQLFESLSKHKDVLCYENDLMNHIIRESLRLYPVAPFIGRFMPKDTEIGGFLIPQNSLVLLSIYSSSHDPAYFPSPDQFQPARWSRDSNNKYVNVRDPYASIPYAIGARSCIGRKLAHAQMCLTVEQLVSKYHIHVKAPVNVVLKLITVPAEPIQFQLHPR